MKRESIAILVLTVVTGVGLGQESRPAAAQSKPTSAPVVKDLFRPNPADKESKALFEGAKGKLAVDWMTRENAKPSPKATPAATSEHLNVTARHRVAAVALEGSEPVRNQVVNAGLTDKNGVHVLPLGRVEWEKAPLFQKPGESGKVPVICLLVATAALPLGDVKGFRVKGEFLDKNGKKVADFNQKSSPATPANGVFLLSMPAGQTLRDSGEYDGFQFRLIEVQQLK